jgi:ABC-type glutathione transport system ATPase component
MSRWRSSQRQDGRNGGAPSTLHGFHPVGLTLQTHNVALASTLAQFVVVLGNGRIVSQGSVSDTLKSNRALAEKFEADQGLTETLDNVTDPEPKPPNPSNGKLVVAEEVEQGRVSWSARELDQASVSCFNH